MERGRHHYHQQPALSMNIIVYLPAETLKSGPIANTPGLHLDPSTHRWTRDDDQDGRPDPKTDFGGWFHGSKIRDADGGALTVYHGGPPKESHEWDPAHGVRRGGEYGMYFTPSRRYAEMYGNGRASAYHLHMKNPLVVDDKSEISPRNLTKADIDRLIAMGHDGIVSASSTYKGDVRHRNPVHQAHEIVAFHPHQIARARESW